MFHGIEVGILANLVGECKFLVWLHGDSPLARIWNAAHIKSEADEYALVPYPSHKMVSKRY
jgi:hypothetical protein